MENCPSPPKDSHTSRFEDTTHCRLLSERAASTSCRTLHELFTRILQSSIAKPIRINMVRIYVTSAALLAAAITATEIQTGVLPPSGEVLSDAARANLFMLTNPLDAVYHGGSG